MAIVHSSNHQFLSGNYDEYVKALNFGGSGGLEGKFQAPFFIGP